MVVGVLDRQPFGLGGGVETGVAGEQCHGRELRTDFEGRGELHRIVTPQPMRPGQRSGMGHQGGGDLDDGVLPGEIESEIRQGGRRGGKEGGKDRQPAERGGSGRPP